MDQARRSATHPLEADIQRAIVDYLAVRGFRVFRRNVMGLVPMVKGGAVRVGFQGQADLHGWQIGTGRAVEIEIKRPGEHPTAFQAAWIANARADNVIAFVTSSVEDCEGWLQRYGI